MIQLLAGTPELGKRSDEPGEIVGYPFRGTCVGVGLACLVAGARDDLVGVCCIRVGGEDNEFGGEPGGRISHSIGLFLGFLGQRARSPEHRVSACAERLTMSTSWAGLLSDAAGCNDTSRMSSSPMLSVSASR